MRHKYEQSSTILPESRSSALRETTRPVKQKNMAGVRISQSVMESFHEMKRRGGAPWTIFRMNDALSEVCVGESGVATGDSQSDHASLLKALPTDECRYAVLNVVVYSENAKREVHKMFYVLWAPEYASVKQKMVYAATSASMKQALEGFNYHVGAGDAEELSFEVLEDICDRRAR